MIKKFLATSFVALFCSYGFAIDTIIFLTENEVANAITFIPAPPQPTDAQYSYDYAQYIWGKSQRNTPRGEQAKLDADISEEAIYKNFSSCFGMTISEKNTPEIAKLIISIAKNSSYPNQAAKKYFKRTRPFVTYEDSCFTPKFEKSMRDSYSYPSGHTVFGWAIALVLAEINVDRQNEILKFGYEFGQSRVICGVHYQSDVDAGRLVASAFVAQLHSSDLFIKQLAKAKAEFNNLKNK